MLVRLFNSIIDLSLVYHYELYRASWNEHATLYGERGFCTIRCYITGHDKVYIHFNNEADARHALDCIERMIEAMRLCDESMYDIPVAPEFENMSDSEMLSYLQQLIQKDQSKTSESYDDGVEFGEDK